MINNFETESEIINYLMTSEFLEDELSPSDMRNLLLKFRYFYRLSHAKQESLSSSLHRLDNQVSLLEKKNKELINKANIADIKYDSILNRELTLKERLKGKIYENEYNRKFHIFKK